MLQIVNVTEARNNLGKLVQSVSDTKKPIIILQDSFPSVVLYPYDEYSKLEDQKQANFRYEFERLCQVGQTAFQKYLKQNKISYPKTEEQAYNIIKNA